MEHKKLNQTRNELHGARRASQAMRDADPADADYRCNYFQGWQDFLHRVEKVWIKAERECQPFKREFEPWQRAFKNQRETDPLLRYVKHARNADQHTAQWTAPYSPGGIEITIPPGETVKITLETGIPKRLSGKNPFHVSGLGPRFVLVPFLDRGVEYTPPSEHLGQKIDGLNPLVVAQAALTFYEQYVRQLSEKFKTELDAIPEFHPARFPPR